MNQIKKKVKSSIKTRRTDEMFESYGDEFNDKFGDGYNIINFNSIYDKCINENYIDGIKEVLNSNIPINLDMDIISYYLAKKIKNQDKNKINDMITIILENTNFNKKELCDNIIEYLDDNKSYLNKFEKFKKLYNLC